MDKITLLVILTLSSQAGQPDKITEIHALCTLK